MWNIPEHSAIKSDPVEGTHDVRAADGLLPFGAQQHCREPISRVNLPLWEGRPSQSPLVLSEGLQHTEPDSPWDLDRQPSPNSTGHLIFHSVASLLQHWPNTLHRNGHSIVPGRIAPGTLLYHGSIFPKVPSKLEWVATDPEHANTFCEAFDDSGCWMLTLMTTRPLKVLYFDGTSAGKMPGGTMDSHELVAWGRLRPECEKNPLAGELLRIRDLCRWGVKYDLDGFVRMEMNFEIMLCDFEKGIEVVSFLNLVYDGPRLPPPPPRPTDGDDAPPSLPTDCAPLPPPPPLLAEDEPKLFIPDPGKMFRVIESGSWHYGYPGENRINLDLTRFVSFYDTVLFPSLVPLRAGQVRWEHRLKGISEVDVDRMFAELDNVLSQSKSKLGSEVDWKALVREIITRYGKRLELLQYILQGKSKHEDAVVSSIHHNWTAIAVNVHNYLSGMLTPYIIRTAVPPPDATDFSWATPIFEACATTHTVPRKKVFSSRFTHSERLILESTETTDKEICRVLTRIWAEGARMKSHDFEVDSGLKAVVQRWERQVSGLMNWLGWDVWISCHPACSEEVCPALDSRAPDANIGSLQEMCYLPGWPFFYANPSLPHGPIRSRPPIEANYPLKPFCIRQVPPFTKTGF
ncbi:hypothetical protein NP233_g3386 [Leucocoprinus birnbaumii]|uniref:Uncharacterized protein n=1 Tax=Leucocoprinus birnbaumii TaxID=56174 RepID=A0AAD5YTX2_9AGAR|nr:hypothetical protein NP233_g3386 [Leucocoprinus birnbaumii]